MDYLLICLCAFFASGLTLFSGFGLGTVLMPVFALFFPLPVAIAATAVVHLANNLFKLLLVGRDADWSVVTRFSIPAAVAALAGAGMLALFTGLPVLLRYELAGSTHEITLLKALVGGLIVIFASLELSARFSALAFPPRYLFLGGLLSGFFGGLTGNQGALRSAFLIRCGLNKEAFVGTSAVSTVMVDTVRILAYGFSFYLTTGSLLQEAVFRPVIAATLCAFAGAFLGARLLKKVTLRVVQFTVAGLMVVIGAGLAGGLL